MTPYGAPASAAMASRPADQGTEAESHYEDDQSASSPSQSQGPEFSDQPLRSIPTFVEDKGEHGPAGTGEDENNGSAASRATTGPSPGLVDKIMQKLGLNSLILMNMFKSVAPLSPAGVQPLLERVVRVPARRPELTSTLFYFVGHPLRRSSP